MRMFLRTTICFKDFGRFHAAHDLYGNRYSGNHIAIFECELKAPPQLSFIDHSYQQYLDAYRMNFRNWKIVDIDNFMDGNHFFSQIEEGSVWEAKVMDTMGSLEEEPFMEEQQKTNPRFASEVLTPFLDREVADIDLMDTNSNRLMSPLHKRKHEIE